jgi:hypothetical protein
MPPDPTVYYENLGWTVASHLGAPNSLGKNAVYVVYTCTTKQQYI